MINLNISDIELDQALKNKAALERKMTKEVIVYIEEVMRRKLYLKFKCSSLHEYLTEHIKYSDGCAQRRMDAALASYQKCLRFRSPSKMADLT